MRKFLMAACLSPALLASAAFAGEAQTKVKVSGWHCSGCAQETEAALKKVSGVKSAVADVEKKEVVVAYDDTKAEPADFEKVISKIGYKVEK